MVTAAFPCTPMCRCWERGPGSITILLQQPDIRLVTTNEVWVVPSSPPTAIEGAGEFGIVNETQGVGLRPVLY